MLKQREESRAAFSFFGSIKVCCVRGASKSRQGYRLRNMNGREKQRNIKIG